MRSTRSVFASVLFGAAASVSGCAPLDDATQTSAESLVLSATPPAPVCNATQQVLECTPTSLRRRVGDGTTSQVTELSASADPLDPVVRTCAVAADCMAAGLPTNSCGGYRYIGINRASATAFTNFSGYCRGLYLTCSPITPIFVADDNRTWTNTKLYARVDCCAGRCVTSAPF
jgi:hypothetical protein